MATSKTVKKEFDIEHFATTVLKKFDKLDEKIDKLGDKVDKIEGEMQGMKQDISKLYDFTELLMTEVQGVNTKLDAFRAEMEVRIERLEGCMRGVVGEHTAVRQEVRDIRHRLDDVEKQSDNSAGFAKEIDHLFQRILVVEEHLGITSSVCVG